MQFIKKKIKTSIWLDIILLRKGGTVYLYSLKISNWLKVLNTFFIQDIFLIVIYYFIFIIDYRSYGQKILGMYLLEFRVWCLMNKCKTGLFTWCSSGVFCDAFSKSKYLENT